jgi:hypothetical protein
MTRTAALVLATVILGVPVTGTTAAQSGWTTLLDGSSLDGWDRVGDANWQVLEGAVQATRGNGWLVSKEAYGDFELHVEFWVTDDANSGVYFRCADPKAITDMSCYEANIFDQRPDPLYRTGAIVHRSAPAAQVNAGGRWNTYEITARGPRLTVSLNGVPMVDVQNGELARGPIALQYMAGTVKFRSVRIRRL